MQWKEREFSFVIVPSCIYIRYSDSKGLKATLVRKIYKSRAEETQAFLSISVYKSQNLQL